MNAVRARKRETTDTRLTPAPEDARGVTIAVFGDGPAADIWAPALRGVAGVRVERAPTAELTTTIARPEVDALCFTEAVPDLVSAIRRATLARRHVLVAAPVALGSEPLCDIDGLAARRDCVVLFDTQDLADENFAFVRRMTVGGGGRAPSMWRPRYIRALCTGPSQATLPEAAISELAAVLSLVADSPTRVSAVAPAPDAESGAAGAVMLTVMFESGLVARVDVSLMETERRQEITLACAGRTVVLDGIAQRAPLRIESAGRTGPSRRAPWSEIVVESPQTTAKSHEASVAGTFMSAIRNRDIGANNVAALSVAALVWETARASIARVGELLALPGIDAAMPRPSLQLIRGGGRRGATDSATPELTVVARSEPPPRIA